MSLSSTQRRQVGALCLAVFVAATSGIVYELLLGTTATYLAGESVRAWSLTIGVFLAAMGLGSFASRYVRRDELAALVAVEIVAAVAGGFSVLVVFGAYAYVETAFETALYGTIVLIGATVGLEIPLLTRVLKGYGDLREVLAGVLAIDYVGALLASVLYPILLFPVLGLMRTAFVAALFNLVGAALVLTLFPELRGRRVLVGGFVVALVACTAGLVASRTASDRLDARLYHPEQLALSYRSAHQHIALTQERSATRLYLNGHLQFDSRDEARYHEALTHVPAAMLGQVRHALILGGGDGLALRELLQLPELQAVTLVDLDPAVVELARSHPLLTRLNQHAFADRRVQVLHEDAAQYVRRSPSRLADLVVVDLPDPSTPELSRLYTSQFYSGVAAHLAPDGIAAVQAGSPYFAREAFWCIEASLRAAGLHTLPYHLTVPSFGVWGFVAASRLERAVPTALRADLARDFMDDKILPGLFAFPSDMARTDERPHTVFAPRLPQLFAEGWRARAP